MELDTLVELLVNEVMEKINKKINSQSDFYFNEKLLLLIEDIENIENKKDEICSIIKKIQEHYEINIILLSRDKLDFGDIKNLYFISPEINDCKNIIKNYSKIFILFLSQNTCAKVAYGIKDTVATNIISEGILNNIDIIATSDYCTNDKNINKEYSILLRNNVKILSSYGIKFFKNNYSEFLFKKNIAYQKIITLEDIKKNPKNVIYLKEKTIITDLAKEYAIEKGVKIIV